MGAPSRTRTYNLRIKSPQLCQLSYRGGDTANSWAITRREPRFIVSVVSRVLPGVQVAWRGSEYRLGVGSYWAGCGVRAGRARCSRRNDNVATVGAVSVRDGFPGSRVKRWPPC